MFDIVGKRRWYYAFSALLTIPGLIFILLGGLKPSVDFTGGTVFQVRYTSEPSPAEVQAALVELGHPEAVVRLTDDGWLEIRTDPIDLVDPAAPIPVPSGSVAPSASPTASASASVTASGSASGSPTASPSPSPSATPVPSPSAAPVDVTDTELGELEAALEDRFGAPVAGSPRSATTVGPIIGADLIRSSAILIIIGELFILAYLWMRFGFRFGTAAIVALLHDVVLVVGLFAILGFFFGLEFDALFVTALLTVIGFSVHDTIVVFDRIRENRVRHAGEPFGAIVNHSILQTMGRSIITSLTVAVTLASLLLLGPPTIRTFTLALLVGVVSGTYSSIFNASQLLVSWYEWDDRRKAGARAAVKPLSR
ncbi:MAG TPA: protein translocase subunit SecF [Candidatus Limnocylindria bacterium]|nr:protein translocase subunit SecF [Candidatus Limnocylindria bacterium]